MGTLNDQELRDLAEFVKLFTPKDGKSAEAEGDESGLEFESTTTAKLKKIDQDSYNNYTWLVQIDGNVKRLKLIIIAAVVGSAFLPLLFGLLLGLMLRGGG
jgi:hypothetical protein